MSGSNSSAPDSTLTADQSPLRLTLHSMPSVDLDDASRRTARGRLQMLLVLLVCALPVIASYIAYYLIKPQGRSNYGELIEPQRPIPADLALTDLQGRPVAGTTLRGQWLLVVIAGGACNQTCERMLWLQRQLREALGRDKGRVDKLWLIHDDATPTTKTLAALQVGEPATVLRVPSASLAAWLSSKCGSATLLEPPRGAGRACPAPGALSSKCGSATLLEPPQGAGRACPALGALGGNPADALEARLYIVDPMGHWMMRSPVNPEPGKLKGDVEKLLRASAGWDTPGR